MSMLDERPGQGAQKTKILAGETLPLVLPLVLGIVLAVAWRLLLPVTEDLGDTTELQAAVDGTLAGLGLVVGLLVGVLTLLWPGVRPVRRVTAVLVTSTLGGVISWLLGNSLGTPALRAAGAAFIWPATTAIVIMVGAILPWTSRRLETPVRDRTRDPSWASSPELPPVPAPGSTPPATPSPEENQAPDRS